MRLGYNTNGLVHHELKSAIGLLSDIGYQSVAITLDHYCLNPFDDRTAEQLPAVLRLLQDRQMSSVVETGARYLLDTRKKHWPTLLSTDAAERTRRRDFLRRAIDVAATIESDCVSLWSGACPCDVDTDRGWENLVAELSLLLGYAHEKNVVLGFEPEPGMLVATMDDFQRLQDHLGRGDLKLSLDVGHLHCMGEVPIAEQIVGWREYLVNVHIEDMVQGVHEHLRFGEGEIEFGPILAAFRQIDYQGGVHVELGRHSHMGPQVAEESFRFLTECTA